MPVLSGAGPDSIDVLGRRLRGYLCEGLPGYGGEIYDGGNLVARAGLSGDAIIEVNNAARVLRAQNPGLKAYADLSADDKHWMDQACGVKAALVLLDPVSSLAREGMTKLKTPDFEYTFRTPSADERARLEAEVAEAVGFLTAVEAVAQRPTPGFSMFGAGGVARARERNRRGW